MVRGAQRLALLLLRLAIVQPVRLCASLGRAGHSYGVRGEDLLLHLFEARALRKLRKQRSLRQLKPFCDHEDWENDPLGSMSPGERLGA